MVVNMKYPSEAHEEYISYTMRFGAEKKVTILLKGSVATQTATPFSDIDLCLICNDAETVEQFISGYGTVVMSARTERPKGILIVVYENGVCVDIDVRKTITLHEIEQGKLLSAEEIEFIGSEVVRVEDMVVPSIPVRDSRYQLLRLFHRSLIKTLSGKIREGDSLLQEIKDSLSCEIQLNWCGKYAPDIEKALTYMKGKYSTSEKLYNLLEQLIEKI